MTAKLILSLDGAVIGEYPLNAPRMTIGRKPHNDIVVNNLAVSGEHAAIVTIGHDSFLEDLNSTNGVSVNGAPVKKHVLQHNDVIEISKYRLKYLNDRPVQASSEDFERTMILRAPQQVHAVPEKSGDTGQFKAMPSDAVASPVQLVPPEPVKSSAPPVLLAAIQVLNGPNAGRELNLVKGLTTLGKPGVQVAVLTRRPLGFFITHVEGASFPSVNGHLLGGQPHPLQDHDLIELAGVKMEFYLKD
jgi:predicted component of type VI protein secretion system